MQRPYLKSVPVLGALVIGFMGLTARVAWSTGLVITPTFTTNFNADFGANAPAAQAAWISAANVFSTNFTDNIHVNITVDAVTGTSVFGQSFYFLNSTSYASLRTKVVADAKSPDDSTAIGVGGSMTVADPTGGAGTWWVTRAEAKAIGLIGDDLNNDGKTTFGTGNPFTFSGSIAGGTYDFKGIAAHEISEVLGRAGISGGTIGSTTNSYSLIDNFSYTTANAKSLGNGPGNNFSINDGSTLIKLFNNALSNGLDSRDWASGTNDAFNQFESSGVVNPVSATDLRLLDVIGYDLTPEPSTVAASVLCLAMGLARRRRGSAARGE
ncbi:MAG: Ca2+-binding protein toxin [Phycisphaerales bacterium]|nr:Ca2+-binding protein toxin [Phycisphaerales bacterium]